MENSLTININVTKEVTKVVKIDLPYFSKSSCHYYKVFSESHAICVCTLHGHESIQIGNSSHAFSDGNKKSKEDVFLKEFNKISKLINDFI